MYLIVTIMQRFQRLQRPFVEKRAKKKEKHGFRKNTELEKKRSSQFSKEIFSRILQCRLQKGGESWIILNKYAFEVLLLVRKKCILALNQKRLSKVRET